jgi:hypothetical protein
MMLGFFVHLAGSALVLLVLMNRLFERLRQANAVPSVLVRGVAALGRG